MLTIALKEAGVERPLIWVYNPLFVEFTREFWASALVYHATEDLLNRGFFTGSESLPDDPRVEQIRSALRELLRLVDGVVCVSDGVLESVRTNGAYTGAEIVLRNGVDFAFWSAPLKERGGSANGRKAIIYQGGINWRLDFALLEDVVSALPECEFQFVGRIDPPSRSSLKKLVSLDNFKLVGELPIEEVRDRCLQADVGIIPFVQTDLICRRSLPLKAFEYLASGLPVVSVPISELAPFGRAFHFAEDSEAFVSGINRCLSEASVSGAERRREIARGMDYDIRFEELLQWLPIVVEGRVAASPGEIRALAIWGAGANWDTESTWRASTERWSRNRGLTPFVWRVPETPSRTKAELSESWSDFDVMLVPLCDWFSENDSVNRFVREEIRHCGLYKIAIAHGQLTGNQSSLAKTLGVHELSTGVSGEAPNIAGEGGTNRGGNARRTIFPRRFRRPLCVVPFDVISKRSRNSAVWIGGPAESAWNQQSSSENGNPTFGRHLFRRVTRLIRTVGILPVLQHLFKRSLGLAGIGVKRSKRSE